jgi:hypothetical protein
VGLVHKAADEIRITISFKSFEVKKINKLIVTSNKLTKNEHLGSITGYS